LWKLLFSARALKDLDGLQKPDAQRIMKKLEQASIDPARYFQKLVGEQEWRLRAGDYRVLALLLYDQKALFISKIGHRKNIYEK